MDYDKGEHLDWWHSLSATECIEQMKKNEVKRATNKLIYKMFKNKMIDDELNEKSLEDYLEEAGVDLGRYSFSEISDIKEAMIKYKESK